MSKRYEVASIQFQANARGANAAIESLRQESLRANDAVTRLKKEMAQGFTVGKYNDMELPISAAIKAAEKDVRSYKAALKDLTKGTQAFEAVVKNMRAGTLEDNNRKELRAAIKGAENRIAGLRTTDADYDKKYADLQTVIQVANQRLKELDANQAAFFQRLRSGVEMSIGELQKEKKALVELQETQTANSKAYKQTEKQIAEVDAVIRKMGGDYQFVRDNISDTKKVSDQMLAATLKNLQEVNAEGRVTQKTLRENATMMREIRAEQGRRVQGVLGGDLTKQNEGAIRQSIATAKELLATYKTGSKEAQALSAQIVNAEEHLRTHGVEGERAARKQAEAVRLLEEKYKMMQDRMRNLGSLSQGALTETQRFWQAQQDGALKGTKAYKEAAANLKLIAQEQQRVATAQLQQQAARIAPTKAGQYRLGALSEQELQTSINAAKQLAASMKSTDPAYKQLIDNIVRAEQHLKQFGLEGQRSTRQAAEQLQQMTARMGQLSTLSDAALAETKKFWEAQLAGAQRGSNEAKKYEANIRAIAAEQERLAAAQVRQTAQGIYGDKMTMSEGAIRRAIEAAKQYQQTLAATNPEYKRLSVAIVDAEEHIKKYGVEAERAARKEIETAKKAADERRKNDQLMRDQLQQGTSLSKTALKAQENYWQRLIDDPKTAATSLQEYKARLQEVQDLQRMQKREVGNNIMSQFQRDPNLADRLSADKLKEYTDALKAYRDTLPKQGNIDRIKQIDEVLQKCGVSAQKAAEQAMSMKQALQVSANAGTNRFKGTTEQLTQAKKVLEDMSAKTVKGGYAWRRMQEAIGRINLELQNTGHISKEVDAILNNPKGRSFNELKQAVEQGRKALANMRTDTAKGKKAFEDLAAKVKEADFQMKNLANTSKGTASAFEKAWQRLKTYVTFYVSAAAAIQKITATMGDLMDLSDRMGEVRKTTGFTADEVGRLSDQLTRLDTRTSLASLMETAAKGGQLGLKTLDDVRGFTEAANKLMVALPEMGQEAATEMMKVATATGEVKKIQEQMEAGLIDGTSAVSVAMTKIGSTIDQLRANSAAAAPQITDFVKRVGAVGAQSGITIDQVAALGSTVDALGMRVEMSATALSRMIPAIKNNAYAIGQIIGKTEEDIRTRFENGMGMSVILDVFEAIRNNSKNLTGNVEEDAEKIENMFGGSMADIMKELNQQGARAGIVFAGLSQNVDELRRQLGIAKEAYEDNIAIEREYQKMNETTAAKWERLKNQIEEFFVGDSSQRWLGRIIDLVRGLVDVLTGNGGLSYALRTLMIYWAIVKLDVGTALMVSLPKALARSGGAVKSFGTLAVTAFTNIGTAIKAAAYNMGLHTMATARAEVQMRKLNKAQMASVWMALAAAIWYAADALISWYKEMHKAEAIAKEALSNVQAEMEQATNKVDKLFTSITKTRMAVGDANVTVKEAEDAVKKAKKALDEGRGSVEDLEKAETDLKVAHEKVTIANNAHKESIEKLNREYSPYLGYMLSEISTAAELANARELINAKLRETILLKQQEAAYSRVESEMGGKRDDKRKDLYGEINDAIKDADKAAGLRKDLNNLIKKYADTQYAFALPRSKEWGEFRDIMKQYGVKGTDYDDVRKAFQSLFNQEQKIADAKKVVDESFKADIKAARTGTNTTKGTQQELQDQLKAIDEGDKGLQNGLADLEKRYQAANAQTRKKRAADLLHQMDAYESLLGNAKNYYDLQDNAEEQSYKKLMQNGDKRMANLRKQRDQLLKEAGDAYKPIQKNATAVGDVKPERTTNIYGSYNQITSPYSDWNADDLVARRKDMLQRVRALANGADVQAVLKMDGRFITDAVRDNIKTTKQAIEWYNKERLKIQDELHNRHLTPTGDWDNPKAQKNRKKLINDDMKAYLEELDAYYTERKQRIEQARADEEITEGEAWRRNLQNEQEWHQRRAELQKLYGDKAAEVTQTEQKAIFDIIAERTGDEADFIRKTIAKTVDFIKKIGEKSAPEMRKILADLGLGWEKDFLKVQQAVSKQMKFIEDTLAKERPYDGLTHNLQENLTKMGILFADFDLQRSKEGADITKIDQAEQEQRFKRMRLLLEQAEGAYRLTFDDIAELMKREGMESWLEAITGNENADRMKQGLMAQLRTLYDGVQDAIKKESSIIKKQVENLWNDALLPDGRGNQQSIKDAYEAASSALGLEKDRVSRANSLIGAGSASERVADRLAIKQLQIQLDMQQHYYNLMRQQGELRIRQLENEAALEAAKNKTLVQRMELLKREAAALRAQGKEEEALVKDNEARQVSIDAQQAASNAQLATLDAQHARTAMNLAKTKEIAEEEKLRVQIANQVEESQNRLYTSLREWADLLTGSLQSIFEAESAGNAEYYNERAKLDLTGKGGPGAGTYVVIDNAGTSDAQAHYEYLDERQALERQHEIEIENARAEAWKKVMDDLNQKMNETITDQINAMLQSQSMDANTQALIANTEAIYASMGLGQGKPTGDRGIVDVGNGETKTAPNPDTWSRDMVMNPSQPFAKPTTEAPAQPAEEYDSAWKPAYMMTDEERDKNLENMSIMFQNYKDMSIQTETERAAELAAIPGYQPPVTSLTDEQIELAGEKQQALAQKRIDADNEATNQIVSNQQKIQKTEKQTENTMVKGAQSTFAKMTAAANLYGTAYQVMSNDNLSAAQKFELFALQAAGNAAISMLTTDLAAGQAKNTVQLPGILGKLLGEMPYPAAIATFAAVTALMGGLMGLAVSQVTKSKSQIAQATGASASAGRLSTGMLTYAEGNVNEFSNPNDLTQGRSYTVDAADGRTYRAKYTGGNPQTHLTSGTEFHLAGERGRELIIDAATTRQITMNEPEIWHAIQTLSSGRRLHGATRRRNGVRAFADGNVDDFGFDTEGTEMMEGTENMGLGFDPVAMQESLDRNREIQELLLERLSKPITVSPYGPDGIVHAYDKYKKEANRHGVKYL